MKYFVVRIMAFMPSILAGNIDTHIHALPPAYAAALAAAGGDPSGFDTPRWTPATSIKSMDKVNTSFGVLSVSSPGVPIAGSGAAARHLATQLNDYLASLTTNKAYAGRFAMFGALTDLNDVEGTLAQLDYLYSKQKVCHGVVVYTSYSGKLLSDETFRPIWQKLESYKALVFLHPNVLDVKPKFIAGGLPQPTIDYPLATTRAAVDLVFSGTFTANSSMDIILAHAGGALPFLVSRALSGLAIPSVADKVNTTVAGATSAFQRFFVDLAVSTSRAQLDGVLDFLPPTNVLYGSDSPYAPDVAIITRYAEYLNYVANDPKGAEIAPIALRVNAIRLLSQHAQADSPNIF